MRRSRAIAGLITLLTLTPAHVVAQERYAVGAGHVAIFNLAGSIEVHGTTAGQVTVDMERGGRDAAQLDVQTGRSGDRHTLRVIYPGDRVIYEDAGRGGSTNVRVRRDGTWGGSGGVMSGLRTVRISSSGRGTHAHANLRVGVPEGQRVDIYLAAGNITATNVNGQVRLDTHRGTVTASGMSGSLIVDTGSGRVDVTNMRGDLNIDTGSGSVNVADATGRQVLIDTGSGRVTARAVTADRLVIDTGSGGVTLQGSARDVRIDTGSGGVTAELAGELDRVVIDTGSGGVNLSLPRDIGANLHVDTGSGGIQVEHAMQVTQRTRSELRGTIGDGRASIRIDTGSGGVRIRAL